ncbi:MAG: ABC-type microcin C transport system duplicated ATPase subunit YejF [Oceanicoccus sp.]|jgi:ABC-type microcin C transport system duplicated ATPase subunit YejF
MAESKIAELTTEQNNTDSPIHLLSVDNLCTDFASRDGVVHAVKNVSYYIDRSEILAIVGESGSGKSVSCYSLLNLIPQPPGKVVAGSALFDGIDLLQCTEKQIRPIRGDRIAMIFQDPMTSLNPYMSIGAQLMEVLHLHQSISKKLAREKAAASLSEVGIDDPMQRLQQYPHEFSGGMRQRVMIAMALLTDPELLIADEPTTALDVTIQAQIFKLLKDLQKKRQLAIIFISHDLAVVAELADRVLVMKDGEIVEQGNTAEIFSNSQHPYTKKLLAAIPNSAKDKAFRFNADVKDSILEVNDLSTVYSSRGAGLFGAEKQFKAVDNISLYLKKGEILGLVGESGCGKSSLSKTIVQLVKASSGSVILNGIELTTLDNKGLKNLRKDIQIIFQDPYASLNPRMSVYDTLLEPLKLHKIVAPDQYDQRIAQLMHEVGLPAAAIRKYPHEFSGGQRQRIAIARALAVEPKLILADEPVSALDVTIQAQVLSLLLELVSKHDLSMLFVSHDLSVVRYLCDRTAVMQAGCIVEINDTETLFNQPQQPYTQQLLSAIPKLLTVKTAEAD